LREDGIWDTGIVVTKDAAHQKIVEDSLLSQK
jgi:hypothetical protein